MDKLSCYIKNLFYTASYTKFSMHILCQLYLKNPVQEKRSTKGSESHNSRLRIKRGKKLNMPKTV